MQEKIQMGNKKTFLKSFQDDLRDVLCEFTEKEGNVDAFVNDMQRLNTAIDVAETPILLRRSIEKILKNIPKKSFSFLPFVNDLRTLVEQVLKREEYANENVLVETCCEQHRENKSLRNENALLKQSIEDLKQYSLSPEQEAKITKLMAELESLNERMIQQTEQHAQEKQLLQVENNSLMQTLKIKDEKIVVLESELKNERAEKKELAVKYQKIAQEKSELMAKVQQLEEELAKQKQIPDENKTASRLKRFMN